MEKKDKILIPVLIGVLILLAAALIIIGITLTKNNSSDVPDSYDEYIQTALTYPTDIFVYGDDCNFRQSAKYTQISELTENDLISDKKYKFIVFNDLYDKAELSDKDIEILKEYVLNGDYNFFYTGNKFTDRFKEEGFMQATIDTTGDGTRGLRGFALRHSGQTIICSVGLWDDESMEYYETNNPELLGQSIFKFVDRTIRENTQNK